MVFADTRNDTFNTERKNPMKTRCLLLAALLLAHPLAEAAPYSLSGDEVTDAASGLVWRRCAEGMDWNGTTCAGTALTFSHENALLRARTEAAASGKAWRLPNVKELSSLVDRSRISPSIDIAAFPATPLARFWSSSPYAGDSNYAWYVDFSVGVVNGGYRGIIYAVRLVRASQ